MEPNTIKTDAEIASEEAIHKAKNAAAAVETAREVQLAEVVEKTALRTKESLLEGLKEVFGEPDDKDPEHMRIIYQKIPVLCVRVDAIDKNIEKINSNLSKVVWIILTAVLAAVLKLILIP